MFDDEIVDSDFEATPKRCVAKEMTVTPDKAEKTKGVTVAEVITDKEIDDILMVWGSMGPTPVRTRRPV